MFLTEVKIAVAALAVGAAATIGIAQEKTKAKSAPARSAQSKEILAKLEERVPMPFPNETPLVDVLKYIQTSTLRKYQFPIPIYVDPAGLKLAKRSLTSTFTLEVENAPLKETLPRVLEQLQLEFVVDDGVLFISAPELIERDRKEPVVVAKDDSPKTKRVLKTLDEPHQMPLPDATTLEDLVKYVTQMTTGPDGPALSIDVDLHGLYNANCTMQSTVQIDLEGAPLRTSLRLALKQLGLAFAVKDGTVVISSPNGIRRLKDEKKP
jgi:hypothetical protein